MIHTYTDIKAEDSVELFGKDHEYTKLIISHKNADPEDVYSTIAYEKGFHFLYYLDRLVGREAFDKFIPHYFTKWSGRSLDSFEFRDTFMDFFSGLGDDAMKQKIATIDWEGRFYTPGLPPKPDFDTSMVSACYELATKWQDTVRSPLRFCSFFPSQGREGTSFCFAFDCKTNIIADWV